MATNHRFWKSKSNEHRDERLGMNEVIRKYGSFAYCQAAATRLNLSNVATTVFYVQESLRLKGKFMVIEHWLG